MKAGRKTRFSILFWPRKSNLVAISGARALYSGLLFVAMLTPLLVIGQEDQKLSEPAGNFLLVGYLPDYRLATFNPRQAALLTDLVYMAAEPKENGDLDLRRVRPFHLQTLAKVRQEYGVRTHFALGGWERCAGFAAVAREAANRQRLIRSLLDYCRAHEFSGVDLDWEFPKDEAEQRDFAQLLAELHPALKADKRSLSIALAPWQRLPEAAWKCVDRVHLMSYDHEGEHATFSQAETDVEGLLALGIPREKLLLGLPCYARHTADREKTLTWLEIVGRYNPPLAADQLHGYSYNGPVTIAKKTKLARQQALGGVFFWEVGQDTDGARSLVRAANDALRP